MIGLKSPGSPSFPRLEGVEQSVLVTGDRLFGFFVPTHSKIASVCGTGAKE